MPPPIYVYHPRSGDGKTPFEGKHGFFVDTAIPFLLKGSLTMIYRGWEKVAGIMTITFPEEVFDAKVCKRRWEELVRSSKVVVENGACAKRFLSGY